MKDSYCSGGKILACGNGGSAADADHIVGELMKGFLLKRPVSDERIPERLRCNLQGSLPAISLPSQCAILSAFVNDVEELIRVPALQDTIRLLVEKRFRGELNKKCEGCSSHCK